MHLYRVLLVDDEAEIREGISRKTNWPGLGFTLVGQAENGVDALEMAEQLKPDVVLTDIKMPFMDGLELCRHLKTALPAAKVVIFSGFDEFEYARQAIDMNVSGYILKPIGSAELSKALEGLHQQLDEQRDEQRNMEELRRKHEESLPLLRELFFVRLMDGWIQPEQVHQRAARYEITLPDGPWAAALVHIQDADEGGASRNELLLFSARAFIVEHFSLPGYSLRAILYNDTVALLANLGPGGNIYTFTQELTRICDLAHSYLGLSLTVGVGRVCNGAPLLYQSAAQARSALEYRALAGATRVIYLGDLEPDTSVQLSFEENDERELAVAVKLGREEDVQAFVGKLMQRVRGASLSINQCQFFLLELAAALVRLARSVGIAPTQVFGKNFGGSIQLANFSSIQDLENWCCRQCLLLHQVVGQQRSSSASKTIQLAKEYIHQNYANSLLSVETLCGYLSLSPAYFSTLFKRETGVGFTAYVTNVRMAAACRLLQQSSDKTYMIAEKTGFVDPNYFSYVFKKQIGVSPSKYREQSIPAQ